MSSRTATTVINFIRKFVDNCELLSNRIEKPKKKKSKRSENKVKKRPRKKSASLKRKLLKEEKISEGQTENQGPPNPQELAVNQQFFVRPFPPQFPPISPNPQMGSPGHNVGGYGRYPWPSVQRNYYPYDRRRRSHLDDIYLPNYEDDDVEEKHDFQEQQFYNNRFHWYTRRSDQRNFYNRPSFVKRAQPRSTCHNNTKETKINNNSVLKIISCTEDASCGSAGGVQDKNCDKKISETARAVKEWENSAKESHVEKIEPKTEDILCDTKRCNRDQEKTKMTEDSKSESITSREESHSSEENENSVPKGDKCLEACDWYLKNPCPAVTEATSDDESEYPYGFLTVDNIDTTKSYLEPPFVVLDNYEVKDMDISPMKRKNESNREDEVPKKTKYDSLYFSINSDRLLNEVNKVLKENEITSEGSTTKTIKRFRSKSLTLQNTSTETTPLVRSRSVDSVNRHKFQVAYNFDLKTNLLLLLKQNETSKKVETCNFKDILKVLKGDGNKESSTEMETVSSENPITKSEDDESSPGASAIIDINVAQEIEVLTEDNSDTSNNQLEEARKESGIIIIEDVQLKSPDTDESNKKEDTEKSIDSIPSVQNGHIQSNEEERRSTLACLKRKGCDSNEEQSKKKCLDSVDTNIKPNLETDVGKTDNMNTADTIGSVEFILEDNSHDISLDSVELGNRSLSRGSQESESLADIEAELKSLLSVDTINKSPESVIVHRKEPVENKIQKKITSNKKTTVSIDKKTTATSIKIDNKTGSKANICAADTESSSDMEKKQNGGAKEHLRKEELQASNDKTDLKKEVDARKDRASTSKLLRDKPVKKHNTVSKNQLNSDNSVHRKTTSSTSQCSFKAVGVLQKPQVKASSTKSKSISYHEYFKRIRSLFGSDSESEMEEEKMINQKGNYNNNDNNKQSNNKKVYEVSTKNEKQAKNREDFSNTAQESGPTYTNFKIDSVPLSLKELSKAIEKRRRSAPVRDHISPLKLSDGSPKTSLTVSKCKPKRIEKRRETVPATLIRELCKNSKPNGVENEVQRSIKARNDKKEKTDKVCIINPKLKDPRKEHHRYRSLEGEKRRNGSIGTKKTTNTQTAKPNLHDTQAKIVEKSKPHQDSEKKDFTPQNTIAKMDHCVKKRNMTKNAKEKTRENPTIDQIVHQVQLPTKLPKTDQTVTADSKDADIAKINATREIELRIENSRQETFQLKLQFCSMLSQDRFPLLQRACSLVQENECCDTTTTLDSIDVNDKIITMTQATEQEDDVIEIRPEIPVIDLTDDSVKDNKVLTKVETKEEKPTIVDKCEEMITLYRSEETVNSSLDIQVTSESISPNVLLNNPTQGNSSNNVQVYNNNVPHSVDNCNTTPSTINPAPHIRPLCNKVVHAPLTRQFSSEKSVCEIQLSKSNLLQCSNLLQNRLASGSLATSPIVSQTSRPSEAYNANNPTPPVPPLPNQRHTNNIQINLQQNYGAVQGETTNRVNLVPPVQQLPATVQQNVNNLWRTTNHNSILQQHPLLYRQITLNSENRLPNSRASSNEGAVHNPMRHANEEGPAPLHEFNSQEIKSTGVVLVKFLLLFESLQEAQCAYKNKLLKIQRYMPAMVRLQIFHFETYAFGRNSKLYKELLKELKGLNLTGRSSSVKSAELLMNQTFRALQPMVADLTLWRVYLMLDSLMQPEAVEYIAVPFLRDLYGYVSFVAGRIRGRPGAAPVGNPQVAVPPRDHFTQEQRAILHWQIKQYNLIRSTQDSLIKRLRNNVPRRPSNGTVTVPQIMQQPPTYSSGPNSTVQTSYGHTTAGKSCPNVTVHQNIVIRPVEAPVSATLNTSSPLDNQNGRVLNDNDAFRIQLPYSCPNDGPPTTRVSSEQNVSQANDKIASPVPNPPVLVHRVSSPKTEPVVASNEPPNEDSTATRPSGTENNPPTEGVTVKEEEKKLSPLLTEQEIQTIDLTWIDDIDPEQLENEMELIAVKKEEPVDEEEEEEVALNEEPFAVAPSPADSGISSPPIQVEYDETVFSNRSCICEKVAEYVCGCMMAMYCSVKCQAEDWRAHKEVCQKYKTRNSKDSKQQ